MCQIPLIHIPPEWLTAEATPTDRAAYVHLREVCEAYAEDLETLAALLGDQYQVDIVEVPETMPCQYIIKQAPRYPTMTKWW